MAKLNKVYAVVDGVKLEVPSWWSLLPAEAIARCHNGIGPARWDERVIALLNKATHLYPAGLVHDVEYSVWKTLAGKRQADIRFKWNCYRCQWERLELLSFGVFPQALKSLALTRVLYRAVQFGGNRAFLEAEKLDVSKWFEISELEEAK